MINPYEHHWFPFNQFWKILLSLQIKHQVTQTMELRYQLRMWRVGWAFQQGHAAHCLDVLTKKHIATSCPWALEGILTMEVLIAFEETSVEQQTMV